MNQIKISIENSRPNIKSNSVNNYVNNIKSLYDKSSNKQIEKLEFLRHTDEITRILSEKTFNSRRNALTSIVVAIGAVGDPYDIKKFYDNLLSEARFEYMIRQSKKQMSEKTKSQWKSMNELHAIRNHWAKQVMENHIPDKAGLTTKNHKILENFLITSLYTLAPPRRNIYGEVQLITTTDFNKLTQLEKRDNFLVFSRNFRTVYFYFGDQKSAEESINNAKQIPPRKLKEVLRLYLKFNSKKDFLLMKKGNQMLSKATLGERVIDLFGIGTTMIRKIYVSEMTAKAHDKIDKIAMAMGHSASTAKHSYLKIC